MASVNGHTGAVTVLTALGDAAQTVACNNSTDDTTALAALGAVSGSTVILPINCTSIITNLVITGSNVTFVGNGTTLKVKAATTGVAVTAGANFKMTGVKVDGNSQNLTTIFQANTTTVNLTNNSFINSGTPGATGFQGGIILYQDAGSTVYGNLFQNIAGYALKCDTCSGTLLQSNTVLNAYKNGWYITASTNVRSKENWMRYIYDYGGSSQGAAGNGIDINTGSTGCSSDGDNIGYTEYSSVRIASASGNSVTNLMSNYAGDWGIYCSDFNSSNNNCSNNTIPTSLGGGIIAANAGDDLAFSTTVNSNNIGWMMGSGTNGTSSGQFANGILLDGFVTAHDNVVAGAKYGIVCNNQENGVFSEVGCNANNNLIMEGRPVTVTFTGTSGSIVGSQQNVQTDKIYLTSGGSLAAASFSANVKSCIPINTGVTCTSPTAATIIPINGYPTAAAITDNGPSGSLTATVTTIVGPANYNLTLGSITGGAFGLFDDVTTGSGNTQAHGIISCSTSIQTSANCATGHYIVSGQLNAAGLMVPFPASGTITDNTTGATATISARTALTQNMQYGLVGNNTDTGPGSIRFIDNTVYGAQLANIGGVNSSTFSGTIGTGTSTGPFANQGTTTQVLHGNAAGNTSFGPVVLTTDVSGPLPHANIASTAVTPGTYPNPNVTIQADGTITAAGSNFASGGGTAQAQTATYSPAIPSLAAGLQLCWLPSNANTAAAPTFSPNGLTARTVVKAGGTALVANDLITTFVACAVYNLPSTRWELINPATTSGGGSGTTNVDGSSCALNGSCTYSATTAIAFPQFDVNQGPRDYAPTAVGTPIYASPSGSGSSPCTSIGSPCSLATAHSVAAAGSNKFVWLRGGTYTIGSTLTFDQNDHDEYWAAYPNEVPVWDFQTTQYMVCQSCQSMRFWGIHFYRLSINTSGEHAGVWFNGNGGSDPTSDEFRWNTFDSYANNAVYGYAASLTFSDNTCKNGLSANNGSGFNYACLEMASVGSNNLGPTVSHNRAQDLAGAFFIGGQATNTHIDHNLLTNIESVGASDMGAIYLEDTTGTKTGCLITDNYISGNGGATFSGSQTKAIYLDSDGTGGQGTNNCQILRNWIRGCGDQCFQLHGSHDTTIQYNILDVTPTATNYLILCQSGGGSGTSGNMANNVFLNNIIISYGGFPSPLGVYNLNGSDVQFASFSTNIWWSYSNTPYTNNTAGFIDAAPHAVNPGLSNWLPLYIRDSNVTANALLAIDQYPAITGAGTISSQTGNGLAGTFVTSTTGTATPVIPLPQTSKNWICTFSDITKHVATNIILQSAISNVSGTGTGTTAANDVISWSCTQ